jgi:hypothetical protein
MESVLNDLYMKSAGRSKTAKLSEDITIVIPRKKAAGGAAGAVVGGIVGGPVGAVVGGVVGAAVAGNTKEMKRAIASGVEAARNSVFGGRVKYAATEARRRVTGAFDRLKTRVSGSAKPAPRKPAGKRKAPGKSKAPGKAKGRTRR